MQCEMINDSSVVKIHSILLGIYNNKTPEEKGMEI